MAKSADLNLVSRAPTRIDLAGGTVDIWPIYLLLDSARTLNLGIDLFAEARLQSREGAGPDAGILLRSEDLGAEMRLPWSELEGAKAPGSLELPLKLLRYFWKQKRLGSEASAIEKSHVSITTKAKSPAGAGLGGSSTLSVALVGALQSWARGESITGADVEKSGEHWIEITRDTETTVIQVPAGLQDYYGAMFGGLQSLRWGVARHARERLPQTLLPELEKRLLLFYSGQSRNSGINNWALFKGFVDREARVRNQFESIVKATLDLEAALHAKDWQGAGQAIEREWSVRRTLADGISTPDMDRAFETSRELGGTAGKICGAGGGGCFFVYLPSGDSDAKSRIQEKVLAQAGGRIQALPFRAVPHGLEVSPARA